MRPFSVANMYIFLGLTTWHWITISWAPLWGRIIFPLSAVVSCLCSSSRDGAL